MLSSAREKAVRNGLWATERCDETLLRRGGKGGEDVESRKRKRWGERGFYLEGRNEFQCMKFIYQWPLEISDGHSEFCEIN